MEAGRGVVPEVERSWPYVLVPRGWARMVVDIIKILAYYTQRRKGTFLRDPSRNVKVFKNILVGGSGPILKKTAAKTPMRRMIDTWFMRIDGDGVDKRADIRKNEGGQAARKGGTIKQNNYEGPNEKGDLLFHRFLSTHVHRMTHIAHIIKSIDQPPIHNHTKRAGCRITWTRYSTNVIKRKRHNRPTIKQHSEIVE